jgi:ABC-type multidrug transport system, ATPase and permease components
MTDSWPHTDRGVDIQSYTLRSLRSQIGMVSQDVVLFDDSIRNNIAFGREHATDEDIIRAARLAYAHDFVERFPQGYQTIVGEKGVKLSGGERQRLAIARAILRDPPLLISMKRRRRWTPSRTGRPVGARQFDEESNDRRHCPSVVHHSTGRSDHGVGPRLDCRSGDT